MAQARAAADAGEVGIVAVGRVTLSGRFGVPADLRDRSQWVVWRREKRDGKETKVPYRAGSPSARASSTDAASWAAFEQAVRVVEHGKADGVGFTFSESDPFCGIDLDGCYSETGELNETAAAIVEWLDSYTELSPSGRGLHVIVRARLEGGRCRSGPVEIYDRGRYFTVTGRRLDGVPHSPMPRQRELDAVRARLFPPETTVSRRILAHFSAVGSGADEELLRRMFAAKNGAAVERLFRGDTSGYGSHSEADLALVSHLSFWTEGDVDRIDRIFRSSGLYREKWERADYRERTILMALA